MLKVGIANSKMAVVLADDSIFRINLNQFSRYAQHS